MDYWEYIKSDLWKQRRYAALERADFRCELCGETDNLNVHHLTYERLGNEDPHDLMVICGGHHWMEHFSPYGKLVVKTIKVKPILCHVATRWIRKIKALNRRDYLNKKSKQRLIDLDAKFQDHIKRCPICKTPTKSS